MGLLTKNGILSAEIYSQIINKTELQIVSLYFFLHLWGKMKEYEFKNSSTEKLI